MKSDYWYDYYTPHYPEEQAACTATVIGIDGNVSGETIYMLQIALDRSTVEYQLVKSLGVILLLDNTGNLVSEAQPHFDIIIKACISGVRDFVRQNPRMRSVEHQITSAMHGWLNHEGFPMTCSRLSSDSIDGFTFSFRLTVRDVDCLSNLNTAAMEHKISMAGSLDITLSHNTLKQH